MSPAAPGEAGAPAAGLVDQYSHGVLHGDLGLGAFERHLAGGAAGTGRGSFFDTATGLDLRRWCPPLLGLEPRCPAVEYVARRRELGAYAAARALLRGSGIASLLVCTGGPGSETAPPGPAGPVTTPGELAAAAAGRAHEVVSLNRLLARVAELSETVRGFLVHAADTLYAAARTAAAFVCDVRLLTAGPGAGPGTAAGADAPPAPAEVQRAAGRRLAGRPLPEDPVTLLRHLLWAALTTGRPVQLRCGDPAPLAGLLRATSGLGTDVVLLPRRPHHRAAARLAAAYPHVYADAGPAPRQTLEEAPFGKLLFSTGARDLPELYVVRARRFLCSLEKLLEAWVDDGTCGRGDAERITAMVAGGTARRVYRLEEACVPAGAGARCS